MQITTLHNPAVHALYVYGTLYFFNYCNLHRTQPSMKQKSEKEKRLKVYFDVVFFSEEY